MQFKTHYLQIDDFSKVDEELRTLLLKKLPDFYKYPDVISLSIMLIIYVIARM